MTRLINTMSAALILCTILFLTSCIDLENLELKKDEAVEIIELAVQGLTTNIEDIASQLVVAVSSGELCDSLYSKTFDSGHQGSQVQVSYTSEMLYEIECNIISIPQAAGFSSTTESTYNSSRMESNDEAIFSGTASGLEPSSSTLIMQGDYDKLGSQEIEFTEKQSVNSSFVTDLTNLEVEKQSSAITSGSGVFSFTGSTTDADFSYSGSLVFNGDGTATLSLEGTEYVIDLN